MSANVETERKRKRKERQSQNGVVSGSGANDGGGGGGRNTVTVEDREVDEFFAILRRMHTAVSSLKRADGVNGVSHALTERGDVRSGDEGCRNGVNDGAVVREREVVEENVGLDFDLNADPVPTPDPV